MSALTIDRHGPWGRYAPVLPDGWVACGTVTDGISTGALARTPAGVYVQVNGYAARALDQWQVREALGEPRRATGRPAMLAGGRRVNVYLDDESLAIANNVGRGNVSQGIRIALAHVKP